MDVKEKCKAIGIDLGTTYSCVGVWQHDRVEIILNEQGNRTTPSMVAFTSSERLVGDAAKFQSATNPHNTVFDAKRLIGRQFTDPFVQGDKILWPFTVVPGSTGKPMIEVVFKGQTKRFAAEEISAMVLMKMKMIAEAYLNCSVKSAVITVPAYFNDLQRKATKDAGTIAGLNVMKIINEPTAAAITYGLDYSCPQEKTILVFDLGGGTFDVCILTVQNRNFEVKAVGGDTHLGGQDFDNRMLDYCVELFNRKHKMDMRTKAKSLRRLRSECERAKRSLSSAISTVIDIDSLYEGQDFYTEIRRAKVEELNADLFKKCVQIVKQCLTDANMTKYQIDDIVLVGGSSRIPKIQELLRQFFDGKELRKDVNPDEAVAYGAAVQAAVLNNEQINLVLTDVTPLSLGFAVNGGVMCVVVPRNTAIPTQRWTHVTTPYDNQTVTPIIVYEGERPMTANNKLLGEFQLRGIPPALCQVPDIRVCFQVDVNGILHVSAQVYDTSIWNHITIMNLNEQLSKEEMERMVIEAERFRREDEEAKKKHLAKNSVETHFYNLRDRAMKVNNPENVIRILNIYEKDTLRKIDAVEDWLDKNASAEVDQHQELLKQLELYSINLQKLLKLDS